MPKQLIAKQIQVRSVRFLVGEAGAVTGLEITCEVNYGTVGFQETVDLWAGLTTSQRQMAQGLYNAVVAKLGQDYLA